MKSNKNETPQYGAFSYLTLGVRNCVLPPSLPIYYVSFFTFGYNPSGKKKYTDKKMRKHKIK